MRVLFATPELAPWVKSGGLGDVSAALPAALQAAGADVRLLVPGYRSLMDAVRVTRVAATLTGLGGALPAVRVLQADQGALVPLYILDSPDHFQRPGTAYQNGSGEDWHDNALRFGLLSRVAALLASASSPLEWRPDVLHCHDWPTALAPAYLHHGREAHAPSVMTVHNIAFQGSFDPAVLPALGLPPAAYAMDGVEFYGRLSFLKGGLFYADRITTVSETYAREIQTAAYGCGFEGLLRHRGDCLHGITNGIDTALWNPATDPLIALRYDAARLERKATNKAALQRRLGLAVTPGIPLLGTVGRLTQQKGYDLIEGCAEALLALPAQLVVLGTGEPALEERFRALAAAHPGVVGVRTGFDEGLAHLIEAGADIFLMPSRFEPCGLNQMYSQRYGTPPIVRTTGGLADTVVAATADTLAAGTATGFGFAAEDAAALFDTVRQALAVWREPDRWRAVQLAGMRADFGWQRSAERYRALFAELVAERAA